MAAEEKIIATITTFRSALNTIYIKSEYYLGLLPNTISTLIGTAIGNSNSVPYIEGELVIEMNDYPTLVDYNINSSGELVVGTSTGDSSNYYVNSSGELMWTGEES